MPRISQTIHLNLSRVRFNRVPQILKGIGTKVSLKVRTFIREERAVLLPEQVNLHVAITRELPPTEAAKRLVKKVPKVDEMYQVLAELSQEQINQIMEHLPKDKQKEVYLHHVEYDIKDALANLKKQPPIVVLEYLSGPGGISLLKILHSPSGKEILERIKKEEGIPEPDFESPREETVKKSDLVEIIKALPPAEAAQKLLEEKLTIDKIYQILVELPDEEARHQIAKHFPPDKKNELSLYQSEYCINYFLAKLKQGPPIAVLELLASEDGINLVQILHWPSGKKVLEKIKEADFERQRQEMIQSLVRQGIKDKKVLEVMGKIPRERFIPEEVRCKAYKDEALVIGEDQTISAPFMVAHMTEKLKLTGKERILEIGTGSGYQAAVLSMLCQEVYTIERIETLAKRAKKVLDELGITNVKVIVGDGSKALFKEETFDGIIVTAAAPDVPPELTNQVVDGGKFIIPIGSQETGQMLVVFERFFGLLVGKPGIGCMFVPLISEGK